MKRETLFLYDIELLALSGREISKSTHSFDSVTRAIGRARKMMQEQHADRARIESVATGKIYWI